MTTPQGVSDAVQAIQTRVKVLALVNKFYFNRVSDTPVVVCAARLEDGSFVVGDARITDGDLDKAGNAAREQALSKIVLE